MLSPCNLAYVLRLPPCFAMHVLQKPRLNAYLSITAAPTDHLLARCRLASETLWLTPETIPFTSHKASTMWTQQSTRRSRVRSPMVGQPRCTCCGRLRCNCCGCLHTNNVLAVFNGSAFYCHIQCRPGGTVLPPKINIYYSNPHVSASLTFCCICRASTLPRG